MAEIEPIYYVNKFTVIVGEGITHILFSEKILDKEYAHTPIILETKDALELASLIKSLYLDAMAKKGFEEIEREKDGSVRLS